MNSRTPPQYITVELADILADSHDYHRQNWLTNRRTAVSILFFVNGFGFANLPTRMPELQQFYGVSNTQLGLVLLCSSVGALAAMLLSSRLMTRFGSRRVATVTALSFAAVPPFLTFIPYLSLLLPLFFGLGAAIGALEVAMNAQAIEIERRFERPLMSSFHAVFSIGGGIGAAVGTAMTWGNISIFIHFLMVGVVSVGLLVWAAFHLLVQKNSAETAAEKEDIKTTKSLKAQRLAILPIALLAFGSMATEGTLTNWTAIFCSLELHATASQSAFAFAAFAMAMTIGRLGGDAMTKRLGWHKLLIISLLVAVIGLITVFLATNLTLALLGLAAVGLGLSPIVPLTYSAAGNTEGVSSRVGIPMISIFGYASFFIMPPVVGFLSDAFGLRISIGILLGFMVGMLALVLKNFSQVRFNTMKSLPILLFVLIVLSQTAVAQTPQSNGTLTVNVSNVKHREGNLKAILQNRSNFLTPQFVGCIEVKVTSDNAQLVFKNLPVGDYAVAIYHDLNANNNFDRNWIGYPSEPFAVSNNLRPWKLLLPSFDAAKVTLQSSGSTVNITLLNN